MTYNVFSGMLKPCSINPVTFSHLQSISYCGGATKTLATPVYSLVTGFNLEAYWWRQIVAVPGTNLHVVTNVDFCQLEPSTFCVNYR